MGQAERNILYRDHGRQVVSIICWSINFFLLPSASAKPKQASCE
jgi:hypothetical protein